MSSLTHCEIDLQFNEAIIQCTAIESSGSVCIPHLANLSGRSLLTGINYGLNHCSLLTKYGKRSGSTLGQVMAWCLVAPSHYLNLCWLVMARFWKFTYEKFYIECPSYYSVSCLWKLYFWNMNSFDIFQWQWVNIKKLISTLRINFINIQSVKVEDWCKMWNNICVSSKHFSI